LSLYAEYLKERTTDSIIETEFGFATYRYLDDFKTVYIIDIYVVPDARHEGYASELADQIVAEAKAEGATKLIGTVAPSAKGSTISLKVLLGYGMTLDSSADNCIVMRKDI